MEERSLPLNKKHYEEPRMEDLDTAFLRTYEGGDEHGDGTPTVDEDDFT